MRDLIKSKTLDSTAIQKKVLVEHKTDNATRMHPSQPLNVIGGESTDSSPPNAELVKQEVETIPDGEWESVDVLCEQCQIIDISDCKKCGIYQYSVRKELFDIKVRRRQNGVSTESSDVKSDS